VSADTITKEYKMKSKIKWLGHSSVMINNNKKILVDPWKLSSSYEADLILITHSHFDHLSLEDIKKSLKADGKIIAPKDCLKELEGFDFIAVKPNQSIELDSVKIETVHAYNPEKAFHPKENNWVGYIIRFPDESIYISGDTDFIPEMKSIETDIAILPIGGTYTMDKESAVEAVNAIKPKVVIPIHYGDIVGNSTDGEEFSKMVKKAEVIVLKPEK
jgi:L-ascorbate metabolism protein UlaG (beta-lactamase superfamily)